MLDRLPPEMRHIALMLMVPLLGYLSDKAVPAWIPDPIIAGLAGVALTALIAYFTPLTRQYGVGSDKAGE